MGRGGGWPADGEAQTASGEDWVPPAQPSPGVTGCLGVGRRPGPRGRHAGGER